MQSNHTLPTFYQLSNFFMSFLKEIRQTHRNYYRVLLGSRVQYNPSVQAKVGIRL